MHLSSLCGTPHVVWTNTAVTAVGNVTNRERYEKLWNPLGTRVVVVDQPHGWNPEVEQILEAVKGEL